MMWERFLSATIYVLEFSAFLLECFSIGSAGFYFSCWFSHIQATVSELWYVEEYDVLALALNGRMNVRKFKFGRSGA